MSFFPLQALIFPITFVSSSLMLSFSLLISFFLLIIANVREGLKLNGTNKLLVGADVKVMGENIHAIQRV